MKFKVNGRDYDIDIEEDVPLLWAIRERVGLTGTKYGCGQGLCGACTVYLEGLPVRSCSTPSAMAEGKEVTTIEGLADGPLAQVPKAWVEYEVPQCGYCQSGQIMSAAFLLKNSPNPSDSEIAEAMAPHLCRCGTYQRIKKAIRSIAEGNKNEK